MTKVSWKSAFAGLTILRLSHHLWVLQFWWSTLKLDRKERLSSKYRELERLPLYARVFVKTANVAILRCCFLQRTTRGYSKKRAVSAARLFFTIRLIKFLTCDAFTPFAIVVAKMNKNKRFACSSRAFFLFLDISFPFSANLRREMTISHVLQGTWTHRREFVFSLLALTPHR